MPLCRWNALRQNEGEAAADCWFENWRMRLPGEHVHHFDSDSLQATLAAAGFTLDHEVYLEDNYPSERNKRINEQYLFMTFDINLKI